MDSLALDLLEGEELQAVILLDTQYPSQLFPGPGGSLHDRRLVKVVLLMVCLFFFSHPVHIIEVKILQVHSSESKLPFLNESAHLVCVLFQIN